MEQYDQTCRKLARQLTHSYSTSFSSAIRFYKPDIRPHIYNIYALVRIADEIVDTYNGPDQAKILNDLEASVYQAIDNHYSDNVIVHAFQISANQYGIERSLIAPFFESMRMDLKPLKYTDKKYQQYIYGSAEVVGLMCLKVFAGSTYADVESGARHLGAAFQKVNFLRDISDDYHKRGRFYFPNTSFDSFDEAAKHRIIIDIKDDFKHAKVAVDMLPGNSRAAIVLAYDYFYALLKKLEATPAATLKQRRIRVNNYHKFWLMSTRFAKLNRPRSSHAK